MRFLDPGKTIFRTRETGPFVSGLQGAEVVMPGYTTPVHRQPADYALIAQAKNIHLGM